MDFELPYYRMLLQGWIGPNPEFVLTLEGLTEIDRFCYFVSCIAEDGHILDGLPQRTQKVRFSYDMLDA